MLYTTNRQVGVMLEDYWSVVWDRAQRLREGSTIYWSALEKVGLSAGIERTEVERLVSRVKQAVQA